MSKSKKQQTAEWLAKQGWDEASAEHIVTAIEMMIGAPKKRGEKTEGTRVWEAYSQAMKMRHGFEPDRNKDTNSQSAKLVEKLGVESAIELVQFYVKHNDAYYVRAMHPFGTCISQWQTLANQWRSGKTLTRRAADKLESAQATLGASSSYLNRKYAQRPPSTQGGENT